MKKPSNKQAKKASKLAKAENLKKRANKVITVKNAEGDPDTTAEIVIQNKINYEPKVSVIIPVYNVEQYLRECLDSVVNQTLKEIEIICVDDGSTDSSLEILKEYANRDNRITVMKQANLHAGVARNAGLAVAKGEYLSFLDSDDWFELNMLKEVVNISQKENSQIVIYQYTNYNNTTKEKEDVRGINKILSDKQICTIKTEDKKDCLFTLCNPMPWNKLFKRDFIIAENLFFQSLTASNDVYFSLLSMALSRKISFNYKSLVYYRHNRSDGLKNTRDKNPFNFYEAYKGVYNILKTKNIYDTYKQTFLTSLISSCLWTLEHTEKRYTDVKKLISEIILPEFNILTKNKNLISNYLLEKISKLIRPSLIISLTSYPGRIGTVNQTIESLLNQSIKADKVILWLAPEQFPNKEKDLPKQLLDLCDKGLTIDWYHDIKSYKKLIPTLKKYPDAIIVTADDDLIYDKKWLSLLVESYNKNPNFIHCHRITRLYKLNDIFKILPRNLYTDKNGKYLSEICKPSFYNKLSSGAGTLFPPHCFAKEILDEALFTKLAPTSDDIWFWLMGLKNGYKVKVVDNNIYQLNYIPNTQEFGLCKINDINDYKIFYKHLNNIVDYFDLYKCFFDEFNENKRIVNKLFIENMNIYKNDLESWYKRAMKQDLNLDNPKTFNEKIQWLKLYDSTPLKTRLADKYLVRDWVKETIGEEYLIPLLGVYNKFDDIDFDKLPNKFVMKCNHASGWNIIVTDKSKLDLADAKQKMDKWISDNFAFRVGCELHYRDIPPKIVIEKFLDEISNNIYDYRFFCCNGQVEQIWLDIGSGTPDHKRKIYDRDWRELNIKVKWPRLETEVPKPKNLEKMIKLSEKMSKEFALVRVDFYDINDKIYFGEMTFTSMSGTGKFEPEIEGLKLGKKIKLPKLAYNIDTGEYYKLPKNNLLIKHYNKLSKIKSYLLLPYYMYNLPKMRKKIEKLQIKKVLPSLSPMRIDIKNNGTKENSVIITSENAKINKPAWFKNKQGEGAIIETNATSSTIKIKAVNDGNLTFDFRASDKRYNGERFAVWVDYKSIKIDGREILSMPIETWHDKPFRYSMPIKNGQEIFVELEQQYHKYTNDELKDIVLKLNSNSKYIKDNINKLIDILCKKDTNCIAKNTKQPSRVFSICDYGEKVVYRILGFKLSLKKQKLKFLYDKVKTDTYTKTYICGICVKKKPANVFNFIDSRVCNLSNQLSREINKQTQLIENKLKLIENKQIDLANNIKKEIDNIASLQNNLEAKVKEDVLSVSEANLFELNKINEEISANKEKLVALEDLIIGASQQINDTINSTEGFLADKIINLEEKTNGHVLSFDSKVADLQNNLSKQISDTQNVVGGCLDDNTLYFSKFEIQTREERGLCDMVSAPNFNERLKKLISGLPQDSVDTVLNIIRRLQLIKGANSKLNIFTPFERGKLKELKDFYQKKTKISENEYRLGTYVLPEDHFEPSVFFYKHGIDTLNSLENIKNKAILDVGAFIGDSALMLSPLTTDKVYSFEAVKSNYDKLLATIKLNNLNNVVAVNSAVGDVNGEIEITCQGSCSSADKQMVVNPEYTEKCKLIKLDDYVKENNINVGLIKVDIEGAEQSFLRGAVNTIKTQKPTLLISIYHNVDDFLDIKPMIESWNLGYKFKVFKPIINTVSSETLLICEQ